MNMLAIDTTTQTLSIAISSGGKITAEFSLFTENTHSERLMPLIDAILKSVNLNISEIDYYACTVGPGSFTGLRIGISSVKGLAYANGKLVVPISSLDALRENITDTKYDICPIIDARKGEVFGAIYKKGGKKGKEFNLPPDALAAKIKKPTIFLGSGAVLYKKTLIDILGEKAIFAANELNYIKAANIARLATEAINFGKTVKPEVLAPVYIRKSDAEL